MKIAHEKGLPELKHHILPRTKGFVLLMKGIHDHITGVYDITVAFQSPKNPELSNLLIGQRCQAEAFIRRIPVSEIPYNDEEKSSEFVHKLFQEKVRFSFVK
jgi:lysophosphatidic acid acyltransferase/lysophosphatidylinositol acyltransferase